MAPVTCRHCHQAEDESSGAAALDEKASGQGGKAGGGGGGGGGGAGKKGVRDAKKGGKMGGGKETIMDKMGEMEAAPPGASVICWLEARFSFVWARSSVVF